MSEENEAVLSCCCAACGIAEVDDIKLKECGECDLVRYCSNACQKNHKSQHKEACKMRAAELRDELLFRQPESNHHGDCPICCLPLSIDKEKSCMISCCSKVVCEGCDHANKIREIEGKLKFKCPFCRTPITSNDEADKQRTNRIKMNDPVAICQEGVAHFEKGDPNKAFEYFTKASGLGDVEAHYLLSLLYHNGHGVEKDRGKQIHHLEQAAIGGHPRARHNLGCDEEESGNIERAVKHYIIAAKEGYDGSIKPLMEYFKEGFVSKEDLASTLRAHQAAVDATKSPQREAAKEFYRLQKEWGAHTHTEDC
eukprot:scaffold3525_cov104-Skeletonema_marinoi.AAC.7